MFRNKSPLLLFLILDTSTCCVYILNTEICPELECITHRGLWVVIERFKIRQLGASFKNIIQGIIQTTLTYDISRMALFFNYFNISFKRRKEAYTTGIKTLEILGTIW